VDFIVAPASRAAGAGKYIPVPVAKSSAATGRPLAPLPPVLPGFRPVPFIGHLPHWEKLYRKSYETSIVIKHGREVFVNFS
jgi:hypothetical protein